MCLHCCHLVRMFFRTTSRITDESPVMIHLMFCQMRSHTTGVQQLAYPSQEAIYSATRQPAAHCTSIKMIES
jgi:hypothetical protein